MLFNYFFIYLKLIRNMKVFNLNFILFTKNISITLLIYANLKTFN